MAKNEAKIKFTAETSGMNAEIQKSNDAMAKHRAELRLVETQMKATGSSVEGLEDKHRILQAQLEASENKTEALRQKVEKAASIFGESSAEVTKLRTQLLNAQTAEEKLSQSVSACEAELEAQRAAVSQTESATDKLTDTINKQQEELDDLKRAYSDVVLEYGKNSKEAKDLAKQIGSLSSELKENKAEMERAEGAADKLDNTLGDLDDAADRVVEGFTVMKGAMADLVADGISAVVDGMGEVVSEAFTMANDIDKATNTVLAQTGLATTGAERFEGVMIDIYNDNFGENFEDIAESVSLVVNNIGNLDDGSLKKTTENALLLRDTFDFDVNESTRAASMLMTQFGVDSDTAFSLITQGAQYGLNKNGDLLDIITEYSVQFKDAGYGAEEMFGMLVNGTNAGTWSVDKLGDAVKEFNIRASDGTVSEAIIENADAFGLTKTEAEALASEVQSGSVEAYQKLREKLSEVDDDTQRYQLGVSMFGTMWEDLGEETVMALMQTESEIMATTDSLEDLNAVKYDDLGSALEGVGRNIKTSIADKINDDVLPKVNEFIQGIDWQGVGQTIGDAFGKAVDGVVALANGIRDATTWMREHQGIVIAVASVIGILAGAITAYNIVQGIKTAMDVAQVTTVWGLVAAHWAQATAAMAALAPYILIVAAIAAVIAIIVLCVVYWDEIVAAVKKAWEAIKETLAVWGDWINENVIQPVVEFFKNLWTKTKEIWQKIVDAIKNAWQSVKTAVSNAINSVKNTVSNIWNSIKNTTSNIWNGIKNAISNTWSGIKTGVSNAINGVKSTVSNVFNGIKSVATNVWNGIKNAITNPIETAKNKVKAVIDAIKGFFSGLKLKLPEIKLPHFKITGKLSLNPPSVPKLSIDWYKNGGILTRPTIFGMNGNRLMAGGEAGAEAILPIDRLEGYIENAINKSANVVNLQALADSIDRLANRPISMNVNGRQFALATAGDGDSVNGLRSSFKSRGLAL